MKRFRTKMNRRIALCGWLIAACCGLSAVMAASADASELVSCRYLKDRGENIELELQIASPPPATVIVIQKLPPGVDIEKSRPEVKKFNRKRGEAKWLLKGVQAGELVLAMKLDKPVRPDEIAGEIRYMDPRSGNMVKIKVKP